LKAKLEEQAEARRLRREQGMPMKQIARRLGVSPSSVHLWTRDIEIAPIHKARNMKRSRQAFSQTWRQLHRDRRTGFQLEGRIAASARDPIHMAGCMLYWAEGAKRRGTLRLTNSDVNMMVFFRRFLTSCFGVQPQALILSLHVYTGNGLSIREIEDHWLRALDLPRTSLRKHSLNPLPTSSSGKKPNKLPYGVCSLSLYSTRIVQHIYGAIQEYGGFEEPRWLDGPPIKSRPRRKRLADAA
jgi:transcriptional regulator with XRE-family HTH domain